MLASLAMLLVVGGTLIILACNVLVTGFFRGSPPSGDRAMGLVVIFFAFIGAGVAILLGSIVASLCGERALASVLPMSRWTLGVLTVFVGVGVTLASVVAFTLWVEPGMTGPRWRALRPVPCVALGVAAPILFVATLAGDLFAAPTAGDGSPSSHAVLRGASWTLGVVSVVGWLAGAAAFGQPLRMALGRIAHATTRSIGFRLRSLPPGVTLASELSQDLDSRGNNPPLADVIGYMANPELSHDAQCRDVMMQRLLARPDAHAQFAAMMRSSALRARWGGAELVRTATPVLFDQHESAWATAIHAAILRTADDMDTTPLLLLDFELKSDPTGLVRSLLGAAERFRGTGHHDSLVRGLQHLSSRATALHRDKRWNKLEKILRRAGYPIPQSAGVAA